jgi:hypothetical protein
MAGSKFSFHNSGIDVHTIKINILRSYFFLVSEKSLKSRGWSPSALKELFMADSVGVDLEDPPGETLAEKPISVGGNCVGVSTLANQCYIKWSGLGLVVGIGGF